MKKKKQPAKKMINYRDLSPDEQAKTEKDMGFGVDHGPRPDPAPFAHKLKTERLRAGLTQTECARLLDVSLHTICKWEKGASALSLTQEAAIGRLRAAKPAEPSLQQQLSAMPRAKLERLAASLVKKKGEANEQAR